MLLPPLTLANHLWQAEPCGLSSFSCHNLGTRGAGIWWVETKDAAKHPTIHRTAPPQRVILLCLQCPGGETPVEHIHNSTCAWYEASSNSSWAHAGGEMNNKTRIRSERKGTGIGWATYSACHRPLRYGFWTINCNTGDGPMRNQLALTLGCTLASPGEGFKSP